MYAPFFGLNHEPFALAPDPRYLFMSERHREALAHLLYGVGGGGGFVLLSGEIGAGKTTVCRCFLEQIPPHCNVAYIFNPKLTVIELLRTVCEEFRIPLPMGPAPTVKDHVDAINQFLLRTHAVGQNNVLIIDEAQGLSAEVLEQLRLLTNLETNERKLLQIMLIGQPELRGLLARPELEQLAQRVIARFHLDALSPTETVQYIRHRLRVAGLTRANPFELGAMRQIHRLSRGVPRRINLLADRALLGAFATDQSRVTRRIVDKAAHEVFDIRAAGAQRRRRAAVLGIGFAGGAALVGALMLAIHLAPDRTPSPVATATAKAPPLPAASAADAAPAADLQALWLRDEGQAWRALASSWNATLDGDDPCEAAERQQLRCFRSQGELAMLRQLDRPAFLRLQDGAQAPVYVVLTGLTADRAVVRLDSVNHSLPLATLATQWSGEFATLWRAPPGYRAPLGEGDGGPLAGWLAVQLAQVQPDGAPAGAGLKARLQAFQRGQNLQPDGLAGPITLMQLNRATGVDEPRLEPSPALR